MPSYTVQIISPTAQPGIGWANTHELEAPDDGAALAATRGLSFTVDGPNDVIVVSRVEGETRTEVARLSPADLGRR